jgi:hypothetical protein
MSFLMWQFRKGPFSLQVQLLYVCDICLRSVFHADCTKASTVLLTSYERSLRCLLWRNACIRCRVLKVLILGGRPSPTDDRWMHVLERGVAIAILNVKTNQLKSMVQVLRFWLPFSYWHLSHSRRQKRERRYMRSMVDLASWLCTSETDLCNKTDDLDRLPSNGRSSSCAVAKSFIPKVAKNVTAVEIIPI